MNFFAKNILFLRKRNDYTQAEMPAHIDIQRATWSNYENGVTEPDISKLCGIADLFKVTIDDLIRVDLSKNVQLNEKTGEENNRKNVQLNVQANVSNMSNEPEIPYQNALKEQVDLLILKQLNSVADDVKAIREKLDL